MYKITLIFLFSCYAFGNNICNKNSDEIIKNIIQKHPNLKMIEEKINENNENINSAYFNFYPSLSIDMKTRTEDRNNFVAKIEQPIWSGGKLTNNYQIQKSLKEESELEFEETSYSITETILELLYSLNSSKDKIEQLNITLNDLLFFEEMLNKRISAGVSPLSDLDLLKSRLENIKSNLISEKNIFNVSKLQLELLTEEKIECNINIKSNIKNIEINTEKILEESPMLKKIDQEIKTSIKNYEKEKSNLMPNLNLVLEHQQGNLYNKDNNLESDKQDLAYLNLTTKLGFANSSEIENKKIKIKELEYKRKTTEKKVIEDYINLYNELSIIDEKIITLNKTIDYSNNVLESYKRLFLVGKRQWLDLANSIQEKHNYNIELSNYKIKKEILLYKLLLKEGKINLKTGDIK